MIFIQGGMFEMGDGFEDGGKDERPVHQVWVADFYMDATEVTVAQFRAFCEVTGHRMPRQPDWSKDDHPVVFVSWKDAITYAEWMGKRLPTEAEWEYAARNRGKEVKYPNGNTLTSRDANYYNPGSPAEDGYLHTAPVGSFPPNELGLYDMAGNVWEWCADWYDAGYYSKSPHRNPTGPAGGMYRVVRGGSWWSTTPELCRAANRNRNRPSAKGKVIGFRCALTP
jgi:formylglycine-generating enzyme required for sulfatase activity